MTQFDVACRTVYNATPRPPRDSHTLLKSAIFTNVLCGLVLFSLVGAGVDGGEDGAVWGHLKGPRVELRYHLGKWESKAGINIEGISHTPYPTLEIHRESLGESLTGLGAKGSSQSYLHLKL